MKGLSGKVVAFTGRRRKDELFRLVERHGGTPTHYPLQGEAYSQEKQAEVEVHQLIETGVDWAVFTTGKGVDELVAAAEKAQIKDAFLSALQQASLAVCGYKTAQSMQALSLDIDVRAGDGTNDALRNHLAAYDWKGKRVAIQLYGDPSPKLLQWFRGQGADIMPLHPYDYHPPDQNTVRALVEGITGGHLDAVAFTSSIQVHHLFRQAEGDGFRDGLIRALSDQVLAVAVGKVTKAALREESVPFVLAPETQRMGAMIVALSEYYVDHRG